MKNETTQTFKNLNKWILYKSAEAMGTSYKSCISRYQLSIKEIKITNTFRFISIYSNTIYLALIDSSSGEYRISLGYAILVKQS